MEVKSIVEEVKSEGSEEALIPIETLVKNLLDTH